MSKFLMISFIVRILSIVLVKSSFVPDEYWQSLEIAHLWSFGYGYRTWEWTYAIRSTLHPTIFYTIYKILDFFRCDSIFNIITMPRLFQAILSTYADYCLYKWSKKSKIMALLVLTSWFWFYCCSRTLINTFETCLTSIALRYYPWSKSQKSYKIFLVFACLACCVRATAVLIWAPLFVYHIFFLCRNPLRTILKNYIPIGLSILFVSIAIDSYFYGKLTLSQWNFFYMNHVLNISSFYGSEPWYWYLINGLPTLLGSHYILLAIALSRFNRDDSKRYHLRILWLTIALNVLIYSLLAHKECRFLMSLMPIMFYVMAVSLRNFKLSPKIRKISIAILLVTNLLPALYFGLVHQTGSIKLMEMLEKFATDSNRTSVMFLMPCHSTPFHSHIHRQTVRMEFITCEPNLNSERSYFDETKLFRANARKWLESNFERFTSERFTFVTFFDTLATDAQNYLFENGYELFATIFHTHFINNNEGNQIIVLKLKK